MTIRGAERRMRHGAAAAFLLLFVCALATQPTSGYQSAESVHEAASAANNGDVVVQLQGRGTALARKQPAPPGKRAVFYSEHKLRSVVQTANYDLRQLKRDFLAEISDIYLALKLDPVLGFNVAQQGARPEAATANVLLAADFADLIIKKFVIQRRLLAGLKAAFVRFMPMETLVRLYKRYQSFNWLRYQSQCELRERLPAKRASKDEHVEMLYGLIEARARARAADDVIALTADNMQRILQTLQWFLVESKHSNQVRAEELEALARQAQRLLNHYIDHVSSWAARLRKEYASARRSAKPLIKQFAAAAAEDEIVGRTRLEQFVDELINVEVLDIDLNQASESELDLELPPTISKPMVANLQRKWIPKYVLKSVEEDRKLVLDNRRFVLPMVRLQADKQEADLGAWAANVLGYVCRNEVHKY